MKVIVSVSKSQDQVWLQHGVLSIVDQMARLPSSSHDWKWPCLTKYLHLRVVCLRLEGNLIYWWFWLILKKTHSICSESSVLSCLVIITIEQPVSQAVTHLIVAFFEIIIELLSSQTSCSLTQITCLIPWMWEYITSTDRSRVACCLYDFLYFMW